MDNDGEVMEIVRIVDEGFYLRECCEWNCETTGNIFNEVGSLSSMRGFRFSLISVQAWHGLGTMVKESARGKSMLWMLLDFKFQTLSLGVRG